MITVWVQKDNLECYQVIPEPQPDERNAFHEVPFDGVFEDLINFKFELLESGVCYYRYDNSIKQTKAMAEKQALMRLASEAIDPLQDGIDLGIATEKEIELIKAWKTYRVNLNRVDTSLAPDIEWPIKPE